MRSNTRPGGGNLDNLESVSESAGGAAVGAILTGMGADGAASMLELRQAGDGVVVVGRIKSHRLAGLPARKKDLQLAAPHAPPEVNEFHQ